MLRVKIVLKDHRQTEGDLLARHEFEQYPPIAEFLRIIPRDQEAPTYLRADCIEQILVLE